MMYFTFAGVDSRTHGVYLREPIYIPRAERKVEFEPVPGRNGDLTRYDGGFADVETEALAYLENVANLPAVFAWLNGAGGLVQSTDAERVYHARVVGEVEAMRVSRGSAVRTLVIPLRIGPFRYRKLTAESVDDWEKTVSGETITNLGTYESEPKITIEGSGDITVWIGTQQVDLTSITGGIIVDSEVGDCFNLAEDELLNTQVDIDEFPTLPTGPTIITWEGTVTKITIRPRWRYL